jgi:hypothetical protein
VRATLPTAVPAAASSHAGSRLFHILLPMCVYMFLLAAVVLVLGLLSTRTVFDATSPGDDGGCLERPGLFLRVLAVALTSAWTLALTAVSVMLVARGVDTWLDGGDPGEWAGRTSWAVTAALPSLVWRLYALFAHSSNDEDPGSSLYKAGAGPTVGAVMGQSV